MIQSYATTAGHRWSLREYSWRRRAELDIGTSALVTLLTPASFGPAAAIAVVDRPGDSPSAGIGGWPVPVVQQSLRLRTVQ